MSLASAIASSSVGERGDRRDRAEDLLAQHPGVGRDVGEHGRRVEVAGARRRGCPPVSDRGAARRRRPRPARRPCRAALASISGPTFDAVLGAAADASARPSASASSRGELVGDGLVHEEPVGRGAGLAHVAHLGEHRAVDGARRGRRPRRRGTGRCRRAPSRSAAAARPTARPAAGRPAVEPVKVSLRSRGSRISGSHDRRRSCEVVTTLSTPSGSPASAGRCGQRQHGQRGLRRRA